MPGPCGAIAVTIFICWDSSQGPGRLPRWPVPTNVGGYFSSLPPGMSAPRPIIAGLKEYAGQIVVLVGEQDDNWRRRSKTRFGTAPATRGPILFVVTVNIRVTIVTAVPVTQVS